MDMDLEDDDIVAKYGLDDYDDEDGKMQFNHKF